jgi:hypothetical protein
MKSRIVTIVALAAITLSLSWAVPGDAAKEKKEEDPVKKMMQAAHKGENSPLSIVKAQVALDTPNWELLATNTLPLAELAAAIKDNRTYTSNPGPYVAAVKALAAAAEQQNLAGARQAVVGLNRSCAGCHRDN